MLISSLPLQNAMTRYVVSVAGPEPAWVRWDKNTGSPCFTFDRPDGLGRADAPAADRLIYLRQRAAELGLNLRDTDLQRKLWEARRRRAGAVEMFTAEMVATDEEDTWAWEGILMAGDSNLIAALPKVGKTSLMVDAIARWHHGASEHLGCNFHGPCPPVIICGTDMPRRRWLKLLLRFGLAEMRGPNQIGLLKDGPIVGLFSQESPIYLDADGIGRMAELASEHPGALLLVDSYAKCTGPLGLKEASNDYAGPLGDLQDAIAPYGATSVVIHHSGHTRAGEGAVAACRGTTALPGAVSQVVALSWLNRGKGSTDKRVVLQTEGRGGEPMQLLIEQQDGGWELHGDADEVFREQQMAEAEDDLQDRQADALEVVRDRWLMDHQRTTGGDLIEALGLAGRSAPRIARRILQQLASRGLVESRKEATSQGATVWFWPARTPGGDTPSPSRVPLSGVSPLSPPPLDQGETQQENAGAGREGTPRTPRTEGIGGRETHEEGTPGVSSPGRPIHVDGEPGWRLPGAFPRASSPSARVTVIDPGGSSRLIERRRIAMKPPLEQQEAA